MTEKILLADGEPALREALAYHLRNLGYEVDTASDGTAALELASATKPDPVILDLTLPEIDGLAVCRSLRQISQVPILILTARASELDKVMGLEGGADDYLTKPFNLGELLARLRALLRRAQSTYVADEVRAGNLRLNLVSHRGFLSDREVKLRPKEFALLAELTRNRGAVLRRDLLVARIWGNDFMGDSRTLDVHVSSLREKIETDPTRPKRILTVHRIGYRFDG